MKKLPTSKQSHLNQSTRLWGWAKTPLARRWFNYCRWIHVYLSTALFSLLIFFCLTGIFLNHTDWFQTKTDPTRKTIPLPQKLATQLANPEKPPLEEMKAFIRQETGLFDARKIDMDLEFGEWTFDFPLPAGYAFITVKAEEATMEIESQEGTLIAIMNDLHKGRHTGKSWSWVIDISAVLLCLLSVTGLFILFQQAKWRLSGLALVILGTILPLLIYAVWVPAYH